jgi:deazaflavin-dependent oxidoreductase (nitroreductase family)
MTDNNEAAASQPPGKVQTMPGQQAMNAIMRTLLRTPVVSGGIGRRLLLIEFAGRKTGRQYSIPVAYTRHDGDLLVGTPFGWARNLRTGEPVQIVLRGKPRQADVEVISDEDRVVRDFDILCRDNRQFAKFNKITVGQDGVPDPGDLHRAWSLGGRVIRLTPR